MRRLIFLAWFIFSVILLNGQSLEDLRTKKEKTLEQIKYTNRLLNEAQKNEKSTLGKLKLLNQQINLRNQLISGYNNEIKTLDGMIGENTKRINELDRDLADLKKEYAEMIRFAQKNRSSYDKTLFLLSAKDFNQAYKRLIYLQQYSKYRQQQAVRIAETRGQIDKRITELETQKNQKRQVLTDKQKEARTLNSEKAKQGKFVASLQKKQKDLQKQLRDQQRIEEQLSREIERIIEEEARKSEKKGTTGFSLTPEQKLISGKLEQNRGRLPWPVERGVITERFGIHAHPVLKTVQVKNNGIDISTSPGTRARSVFDGEVSRVFGISGGNMAVIIRHGNYLTVYSNLKGVTVKAGDKIQAKQELGTIFTDETGDGRTTLKFQIWKESQKLDPELWLSK
ncbi:MAG: peptidoglycan DD-metalloendopeptidase family protein [Prolixibacteraceae bacterium]|jgi:septal ring factor EnvC (AmiA/AmiB activator)|nr:peptidoglycan DD-metalloendopeptidase family protein [Prolixibacteraceae bacterium]